MTTPMKRLRLHKKMRMDLVTIEVVDEVQDVLKRIALLNGALFSVLTGGRLVRVIHADYEAGCLEALIESAVSRPPIEGRVSVRYEPQPT